MKDWSESLFETGLNKEEKEASFLENLPGQIHQMLGSAHNPEYRSLLPLLIKDILNPMLASNPTWNATLKKVTQNRMRRLNPYKGELVELLVTILSSPSLFKDFWQRISAPSHAVLNLLRLKGPRLPRLVQEETGFQLLRGRDRLQVMEWSDPMLYFFVNATRPRYWESFVPSLLLVDPTLAIACKKYLPSPEVTLVKGEPSSDLEIFHDPDAAAWFHHALTYVAEGNLKTLKSGKSFTAPSLNTMAREIGLNEFFTGEDKKWTHCRKEMVAALLFFLRGSKQEQNLEGIRTFFRDMFKDIKVPYVFFMKNYSTQEYPGTNPLFGLGLELSMMILKDGDWVEADSLLWYARSKGATIDLLSGETNWLVKLAPGVYSYTHQWHEELALRPCYYMGLFLMGAFGLLDLAYLPPSRFHNSALDKEQEKVLTPYDGLKWVRLTPLGAYVLGVTKEPPAEIAAPQRAEVTLDTSDLIISVEGDDPSLRAFLTMIAKTIGPNRYLVDFQSFFQGLDNDRLESRIEIFKNRIPATIPPNWDQFFEEARYRAKPLVPKEDMVVFHVADNPTLAHHLVRDPKLRELVVKAENQFILVERSRVSSLRQRLRQLGFLL